MFGLFLPSKGSRDNVVAVLVVEVVELVGLFLAVNDPLSDRQLKSITWLLVRQYKQSLGA